jgi:hypothetical protein
MSVTLGSLARTALRARPLTPATFAPMTLPCRDFGSKRSAKGLYGGKVCDCALMQARLRRGYSIKSAHARVFNHMLCICVAPQDIGFGNKVSHSERKSRRSWKPNVQSKRLWSELLQVSRDQMVCSIFISLYTNVYS